MKTNKVIRILFVALVAVLMILVNTTVFADVTIDINGVTGTGSDLSNSVKSAGNTVLGVVQTAAAAIAVVILVVLAIKYIMASPEGKADIKKTAYIYVVGAVIMFGASAILRFIQSTTGTVLK